MKKVATTEELIYNVEPFSEAISISDNYRKWIFNQGVFFSEVQIISNFSIVFTNEVIE